jgi:hypothetical protein
LNVPRVTVRGLTVRAPAQGTTSVGVGGASPGVVLEQLTFTAATAIRTTGTSLDGLALGPRDEPITVRRCKFTSVGNGVELIGQNLATGRPLPCRGMLIADNDFGDCVVGVWALGQIGEALVAGNRFWGWGESAIRLANLSEGSGSCLIVNNSFRGGQRCVEVIEPTKGVEDVQIRANVMIADLGMDMLWSGARAKRQPWVVNHNFRKTRRTSPGSPESWEWIGASGDQLLDRLPLLSLEPAHPGFLRPEKGSALATGGVGGDLPGYVGAVPPEGVEPWDWQKTWQARARTAAQQKSKGGTD